MNDTQLKNAAGDSKALFIAPETFELIRTAARGTIVPDKKQFLLEKRGNQSAFSLIHPPPENPVAGDMSYFDGTKWVSLTAPAPGSILTHNGTIPLWLEPTGVDTIVLTNDGTSAAWTGTEECA